MRDYTLPGEASERWFNVVDATVSRLLYGGRVLTQMRVKLFIAYLFPLLNVWMSHQRDLDLAHLNYILKCHGSADDFPSL